MKLQHTPEPWTYTVGEETFVYAGSTPQVIIAMVFGKDDGNTEANASLISAVPELLEACKLAMEYFKPMIEQRTKLYRVLADAIAKAEGKK